MKFFMTQHSISILYHDEKSLPRTASNALSVKNSILLSFYKAQTVYIIMIILIIIIRHMEIQKQLLLYSWTAAYTRATCGYFVLAK